MTPKNTICLWYDKGAHDAARFYAATFPDSKVTAVHKAPADYPSGKKGDELTVEFTVTGTRSSTMEERKASAAGARTAGAFPGRSRRAR